MKLSNANIQRAKFLEDLITFFTQRGEDVGQIASNVLNFPVVSDDGEEGWIEITVKVPKGTKDEEYDGYGRRESFQIECAEKEEKRAKAAAAKEKKIAKDAAKRKKTD